MVAVEDFIDVGNILGKSLVDLSSTILVVNSNLSLNASAIRYISSRNISNINKNLNIVRYISNIGHQYIVLLILIYHTIFILNNNFLKYIFPLFC